MTDDKKGEDAQVHEALFGGMLGSLFLGIVVHGAFPGKPIAAMPFWVISGVLFLCLFWHVVYVGFSFFKLIIEDFKQKHPKMTQHSPMDGIDFLIGLLALVFIAVSIAEYRSPFAFLTTVLAALCAFAFLHEDWRPWLLPVIKVAGFYYSLCCFCFIWYMYADGKKILLGIGKRKEMGYDELVNMVDQGLRPLAWGNLNDAFIFPYTYVRKTIPYLVVLFNN